MNDTFITPLPTQGRDTRLRAGLRAPGLLGRRPLIGVTLVALGCLLFGAMAVNLLAHGPLLGADARLSEYLHAVALQSPPAIRGVMIFGYYLGEHVIVAIGLLLAIYFLRKKFWPELWMVGITWTGEGMLWLIISQSFARARPVFAVSILRQMTHAGFPSGHCVSAIMCFGLLAYLLVPKMTSRFWKAVVIAAAGLVILYIGFSRIFVGDHWLTDVLAGYGLGVAWSAYVYTLVEMQARTMLLREKSVGLPPNGSVS